MAKLDDFFNQVPHGNRCIIWVYLYEAPDPSYVAPVSFRIVFQSWISKIATSS